ncbi:MAG: hypothetical protein LBQ43_03970, partial [Holosporales bacterium]|jgi:hypothetical protein|nr:hypothetical protein [Holosporales bacterium]
LTWNYKDIVQSYLALIRGFQGYLGEVNSNFSLQAHACSCFRPDKCRFSNISEDPFFRIFSQDVCEEMFQHMMRYDPGNEYCLFPSSVTTRPVRVSTRPARMRGGNSARLGENIGRRESAAGADASMNAFSRPAEDSSARPVAANVNARTTSRPAEDSSARPVAANVSTRITGALGGLPATDIGAGTSTETLSELTESSSKPALIASTEVGGTAGKPITSGQLIIFDKKRREKSRRIGGISPYPGGVQNENTAAE